MDDVGEPAGDRIDTLILPKVESAADVTFLDRLLTQIELAQGWPVGRIGIEVLIESASGVQQVDEIARSSARLEALIFGPGDLSASLGLGQLTIGTLDSAYPGDIWPYALMRLPVAARTKRSPAVADGSALSPGEPPGDVAACAVTPFMSFLCFVPPQVASAAKRSARSSWLRCRFSPMFCSPMASPVHHFGI